MLNPYSLSYCVIAQSAEFPLNEMLADPKRV